MERLLVLEPEVHAAILAHLLPERPEAEETAFVFADVDQGSGALQLVVRDWYPVPPNGFRVRSLYHLELADETRARVFKRAHQLGAALVELHAHPYPGHAACFSPSDRMGFAEFVPHAWWRLPGRPYAAVVVAPGSFDALVWVKDPHTPEQLAIEVGGHVIEPTGRTLQVTQEDAYGRW